MSTIEKNVKSVEREDLIQFKPVILAYGRNLQVRWEYLTPAYARVGFLSSIENHGFQKYVNHAIVGNYGRVFKISTAFPEGDDLEQNLIDIINGFEVMPSKEGQYEFANYRLKWVHLFFRAICLIENKNWEEFIPRMQFRQHAEGPLMGYIRAILNLDNDDERKEILQTYLSQLSNIEWFTRYDENKRATEFIYKIKGENLNNRIMSLLLGAWSSMIFCIQKAENEMFCQIIELIEDFYGSSELNDKQKEVLGDIMKLLSELTHPSLDLMNAGIPLDQIKPLVCQFVQSSRIFPLIHTNSRHVFYGEENVSDFSLSSVIGSPIPLENNTAIWRFKENQKEYLEKLKISIAL